MVIVDVGTSLQWGDFGGYSASDIVKTYISGNDIFVAAMNNDASRKLKFMRITYDPISTVWAQAVDCPNVPWTISFSEAIASEDRSKIYALIRYGNPNDPIFFTLDASTGNAIGSRYKASHSIWVAMHVHNDHLYIALRTSVIIYNTVTNTFKQFEATGFHVWKIVPEWNSNRYTL